MTDLLAQGPLPTRARFSFSRNPGWLCGLLLVLSFGLALSDLGRRLPVGEWLAAMTSPAEGDMAQLILHFSWLPRLCMALLCGAVLALAGTLMQQVLRNPLASPTTLGVSSGAQLGLLIATLWAPWALDYGREWVALAGGGLASLLVFALAWRRALAPLTLILAGLVVTLYLSALNVTLMLVQQQDLNAVFIWGSGSLSQNSWGGVQFLLPRLAVGLLLLLPLLRPLALLELDDSGVKSLGVPLRFLRIVSLTLSVYLAACVVSVVGVIGFIGLAAPALVRLLGARSFAQRLVWAPLLGGLLLCVTDLGIQRLAGNLAELVPTGAATALLGAPLLLWLLPRLHLAGGQPQRDVEHSFARHPFPARRLLPLLLALAVGIVLALGLGCGLEGWSWNLGDTALLDWRWPRVMAAAAAGCMLALAGCMIQRLTGNPMSSPEVLGISAGAALGLIALLFLLPYSGPLAQLALGGLGAGLTLLLLLGLSRRSGFAPEKVLLIGISITALFDALQVILLAGGDPRGQNLLSWMSGSTYFVGPQMALWVLVCSLVLLAAALPFGRWLELLPLGEGTPRALGVPLGRGRLVLLLLAALLTAGATLIVGPLSFIGLLAPHLARLLGLARAVPQLLGAALLGALVMVAADWLGRTLLFPAQLPAGLLASLLGGAYFMLCLYRR
ncbi:Fe(3+)-hydroxamate ABC transporter permease FhuB [Pseudomonas alcaligenes]|jgi:iron complex transport system permease protein|uniref:Fe(3+)-hydroxamate ABC transporter permease FhuB n=1 Tax=Aquipseudomonas alcaligenes TaxID=43263 RepID=UPI002E7B68F0|nr:Fe(3+)-hydroxamate ABC transporter permease FhuB [Pseudomonas alcaligenes]MEE1949428.1 Fe(3+)-hydroxamate ABC transporter permease FhuB [Pseudomonas alcaligenes]